MQTAASELSDRRNVLGILAGLLIGSLLCAWCAFAWLPAEAFFRGASPKQMRTDEASKQPQYRDIYIADVGRRYQAAAGANAAQALREAQDLMGVTTGDVTKEEALAMIKFTQEVVKKENATDGTAGKFTPNDELALAEMQRAIEAVPAAPTSPTATLSRIAANRNLWGGGLGLCLLIPLILLGLVLVLRALTPKAAPVPVAASAAPATVKPASAQVIDASPVPASIAPQPAGGAPSAAAPVAAAAAVGAVAAAAQPPTADHTFVANFSHGDDAFDEDFAITGRMGEFEGECAVSIANRLGADVPARVCAFAIWVFDKADLRTTTRVVASDYAMQNAAIKQQLSEKGEVLAATNGLTFEIATTRMRVLVLLDDVTMNTDEPVNSHFLTARITFTVQRKDNAANVSM